MNIGITSSSIDNFYVVGLIEKLSAQSDKPLCVIISKKSIIEVLLRHYKREGIIGIVKKLIPGNNTKTIVQPDFLKIKDDNDKVSLSDLCGKESIEIKKFIINSSSAVKYVQDKKIDILINAGGGIFNHNIINAPQIGILNAHMGYLPEFRGMNVLEWSLFYNHKIGVTLHFIDRGIDTGDILMFKEMKPVKGDTIKSLRAKTRNINISLMSEGIKLLREDTLTRRKQQKEEGKQYFVMHSRLRKQVEVKNENFILEK